MILTAHGSDIQELVIHSFWLRCKDSTCLRSVTLPKYIIVRC